jgi:hypothetical protein
LYCTRLTLLRPVSTSSTGTLRFRTAGWYEILLTVGWDRTQTAGTRFAHTAIPDHHPLHSEAINAAVLAALSEGTQLLRGNTIFEPGTIDRYLSSSGTIRGGSVCSRPVRRDGLTRSASASFASIVSIHRRCTSAATSWTARRSSTSSPTSPRSTTPTAARPVAAGSTPNTLGPSSRGG